jgi:hypothetical protein
MKLERNYEEIKNEITCLLYVGVVHDGPGGLCVGTHAASNAWEPTNTGGRLTEPKR